MLHLPPRRAPLLAGYSCILFLSTLLLATQVDGSDADEKNGPFPPRPGSEREDVRFNRDVRPLLADRCFHCHGPDANDRKGKLRLDTADGPQGAYRSRSGRPAIRPGSIEESEVWSRLTTDDDLERMPPADSHRAPLSAEERDIIKRWIEDGAEYEEFWSFVAPRAPAIPDVENQRWIQRPVDRFVLRGLEASGLRPSPRADKRTLIRRVSFDLTGLPPTRDEIRAFLSDDRSGSFERLVDRLLSAPQYGEHMAKYWLDLVRFADTNGVHHDHYREMTHYRDWVIRSWNANLPYDQFITDQVAGDLYADPTTDQLTASGFNRLHMIIDRGTMLPEESLTRNVIDRVTAVGTAFLGLTLQCAVCHDHKYDPIRQRDFFQLYAFFNNFDGEPETGGRGGADFVRGLQPPYISFPTREQTESLDALDRKFDSVKAQLDLLESELAAAKDDEARPEALDVAAGDKARREELTARVKQTRDELNRLRKERTDVEGTIDAAMVMKERAEVRPTHILIRGDYKNPGELVKRDTPNFLPPMKTRGVVKSRMDLAEWLVARDHPLTARVAVNHFWQQLFGVGIVKTSEDFGTQGEWPSHIDALDHLAVSFVESGWDVKALLRELVLSATYQQSSIGIPAVFEEDPENRRLARGARFRMDSEMIRDQILASSGLLNSTMFGRSVKPPQPAGIWDAVRLPDSYPGTYVPDEGDQIYRRSIYTFWKRGMPPPQMSMLDAPTRESCTARRERTNTPLQALLLLNEEQYLKAAARLAFVTLTGADRSPAERLGVIYETITSRVPIAAVSRTLLQSVRDLEAMYAGNPELAMQLCGDLMQSEDQDSPALTTSELAAWTVLVSTVYNLDITKTRE